VEVNMDTEMDTVVDNDGNEVHENLIIQHLGTPGYSEEYPGQHKEESLDLASLEREARSYFRVRDAEWKEYVKDCEGNGRDPFSSSFSDTYADSTGPWMEPIGDPDVSILERRYFYGHGETRNRCVASLLVERPLVTDAVGYEGSVTTDASLPSLLENEQDNHESEQEDIETLAKMTENAVLHNEISEASRARRRFFGRMVKWTITAKPEVLAVNIRRFWNLLNESRERASRYNLWYRVLLTKTQANIINRIARKRLGWKVG
jgi:hypothetical protein